MSRLNRTLSADQARGAGQVRARNTVTEHPREASRDVMVNGAPWQSREGLGWFGGRKHVLDLMLPALTRDGKQKRGNPFPRKCPFLQSGRCSSDGGMAH